MVPLDIIIRFISVSDFPYFFPITDPNLTKDEQYAVTLGLLHAHCTSCINRYCNKTPDGLNCCSTVDCPYSCGQRFHRCKLEDHEKYCLNKKVPCINSIYGCPYEIIREQQASHMSICPANVVKCMIEWHRWPMHSSDLCVKAPLPLNNPHVQCGQLDVALALRDQRLLLEKLASESKKETNEKSKETTDDVPWKTPKYPPGLQKSVCHGIFSPSSKENDFCSKETVCNDRNNFAKEHASSKLDDIGVDYISSQMGLAGLRRLSNIEREKQKNLESLVTASSQSQEKKLQEEKTLEEQEASNKLKEEAIEEPDNDDDKLINLYKKKIQLHELLGVCLTTESHADGSKLFTFNCNQHFRRDEIAWHFKNVHAEIQSGLNGFMEQRCPLAYLGCDFTHRRFVPQIPKGKIVHSSLLGSFGLAIDDENNQDINECIDDLPTSGNKDVEKFRRLREATPEIITSSKYDSMIKVIPRYRRVSGPDIHNVKLEDYETLQLINLPMEILECILDYLDGFSLNNLSLTCTTLRNLCASMLHQKGMVLLEWGKQDNSKSWQIIKKVSIIFN